MASYQTPSPCILALGPKPQLARPTRVRSPGRATPARRTSLRDSRLDRSYNRSQYPESTPLPFHIAGRRSSPKRRLAFDPGGWRSCPLHSEGRQHRSEARGHIAGGSTPPDRTAQAAEPALAGAHPVPGVSPSSGLRSRPTDVAASEVREHLQWRLSRQGRVEAHAGSPETACFCYFQDTRHLTGLAFVLQCCY